MKQANRMKQTNTQRRDHQIPDEPNNFNRRYDAQVRNVIRRDFRRAVREGNTHEQARLSMKLHLLKHRKGGSK